MSRDASVTKDWAGDARTFRLAWGELIKLQESRDAGPFLILQRLLSGAWFLEDIREVIRLGLIGGGLDKDKALQMIRTHVEGDVPGANLVIAQAVLGAALYGVAEEEVGKKQVPADQEGEMLRSPTESSGLPASLEAAR